MPFPEINLKQAWLIPSATALAEPERHRAGLVGRPAGRPGHRRAARAAARDAPDVARLRSCPAFARAALGADRASGRSASPASANRCSPTASARTLLRRRNPVVATYARVDAVDVRMSAVGQGPTAEALRPRAELARRGRAGRRGRRRRPRLGDGRDDLGGGDRGRARRARPIAGLRRGRDGRGARARCSAPTVADLGRSRSRSGLAARARSIRRRSGVEIRAIGRPMSALRSIARARGRRHGRRRRVVRRPRVATAALVVPGRGRAAFARALAAADVLLEPSARRAGAPRPAEDPSSRPAPAVERRAVRASARAGRG